MEGKASNKKVCLIVIDGWGISDRKDDNGNAVARAECPVVEGLMKTGSFTTICAHGRRVGLPHGLMGNSEVGHLNIGAGRVVVQDIVRINETVEAHRIADLDNFKSSRDFCMKNNGRLHLVGLISDGGVHSHIKHLFELVKTAKDSGIPKCYIHFIADGRDTAPDSSVKYLKQLQEYLASIKYGILSTISGRYYTMDRDKRWERTMTALECLVDGKGQETSDPLSTIKARYAEKETDEFLKPIIVDKEGVIKSGDSVITFNYRSDRMRQITSALGQLLDKSVYTTTPPENISITTMTVYDEKFTFPVLFKPQNLQNVLAEWLAHNNCKQVHIAETEKYAHVTFFFNGGVERKFNGEDRVLVPSPKVPTYDLNPEMSVIEVAQAMAKAISSGEYTFAMCNLAPPDMVGHTGHLEATIKAVTATDKAIGIIAEACAKNGYTLFVTSDHGNAEKMISDEGGPLTAHTTNPVFLISSEKLNLASGGALCDVAPTILDYLGITPPSEMTGKSLLQ